MISNDTEGVLVFDESRLPVDAPAAGTLATSAKNQDESVFQFAQDHTGVVLLMLALLFGAVVWLFLDRERQGRARAREISKLEEAARLQEQQALRDLVEQQSIAIGNACTQISRMATQFADDTKDLHGRVTDLSNEFHELQGEHNHAKAICPFHNQMNPPAG